VRKWLTKAVLVGAVGIGSCLAIGSTSSATIRATESAPTVPGGLTASGELLWNFESLLHATFGEQQPFSSANHNFDCAGISCGPLSKYDPFTYTFKFSILGKSEFHLSTTNISKDNFGNYPAPVYINGKAIACDLSGNHFLTIYRDQISFTLLCLSPQPA
jgi:hypothetical protein